MGAAMAVALQFVFADLAAQRIAVNAQYTRGTGLIAAGLIDGAFDEAPLEFRDCFLKQNPALHHLPYEGFQLISQVFILRSTAPGACCGSAKRSLKEADVPSIARRLRDTWRAFR